MHVCVLSCRDTQTVETLQMELVLYRSVLDKDGYLVKEDKPVKPSDWAEYVRIAFEEVYRWGFVRYGRVERTQPTPEQIRQKLEQRAVDNFRRELELANALCPRTPRVIALPRLVRILCLGDPMQLSCVKDSMEWNE